MGRLAGVQEMEALCNVQGECAPFLVPPELVCFTSGEGLPQITTCIPGASLVTTAKGPTTAATAFRATSLCSSMHQPCLP